jgi:acetyltransferase-like isoleucine patch superfamily enzyme
MVKNTIKKLVYMMMNIVNTRSLKKNNVQIKGNFLIRGIIHIRNSGQLTIGDGFEANSSKRDNPIGGDTILRLIVKKNAILSIGENVGISNSTIRATNEIQIGNNVKIGGDCKIWDTDFHSIDPKVRLNKDNQVVSRKIIIKDSAFIGGGSIILKGVIIGKNSIVGAGSVVSKNIPDNEIWAGNPASFLKKIK